MDERGLICSFGIYVSGCRVAVSALPDRGDLLGALALTQLQEIGDLSSGRPGETLTPLARLSGFHSSTFYKKK